MGDNLYEKSVFVDADKMRNLMNSFNKNFPDLMISEIEKDPAFKLQKSILNNYFEAMYPIFQKISDFENGKFKVENFLKTKLCHTGFKRLN